MCRGGCKEADVSVQKESEEGDAVEAHTSCLQKLFSLSPTDPNTKPPPLPFPTPNPQHLVAALDEETGEEFPPQWGHHVCCSGFASSLCIKKGYMIGVNSRRDDSHAAPAE